DLAADGLGLLGDEHQAEAAFADLLHELVGADLCADRFGASWWIMPDAVVPRARAVAPGRWHRCDAPRPALREGNGTARETDRTHRRTAVGHGPNNWPQWSAVRPAGCATGHRTSGSAAAVARHGA